ncbi:MAG: ATP-dependent DNA helicase RecG, partial [Fimbriimonadales bacterium]|nr:ATP-dependent DNA helicase RecG [Fimbriimonadales bacterium]
LYTLPRRYEDRTNFRKIRDIRPGEWVTVKGRLIDVSGRTNRGNFRVIRAVITDGSGSIGLIWFNQSWIEQKLRRWIGEMIVYGRVQEGDWGLEIATPEWELVEQEDDPQEFARITPVYSLTEGMVQKRVRRIVQGALSLAEEWEDPLPERFRQKHRLAPLGWALRNVHFPESESAQKEARRRLVFEEFFFLQLALALSHRELGLAEGIAFDIPPTPPEGAESGSAGERVSPVVELRRVLPWDFTRAQLRVMEEIFSDMRRPHPMNRLLQGDVGSGKTIVAASAMLAAARCGYQSALMAPTEILAEQHFFNFRRLLEPLGVPVSLLVGKQSRKERGAELEKVKTGASPVVIGTHALIQEGLEFHRLGLVVVDEQHRFGVMQRASLRRKGFGSPDVLVMTATPIPRSLTLALYGDLDLSVLDEMPPGRKPVRTYWKLPSERAQVYEGVRKLLQQGAQVYVVCPLVSESESLMAQAAEDLYAQMKNEVFPEYRVGLLHGQLPVSEKEEAMERFRRGELDVLVCTTVIEVGVDVPNATVMIIEDANRFGLAQLHQLRGRVGRGGQQSYCVLIGEATTKEAERRLRIMVETNDGFRIAEEDLNIRGPGEVMGTRQSGMVEFRVGDLLQDGKLLEEARQAAFCLLEEDPELSHPENRRIAELASKSRSRIIQTDVS